MIYKYLADLVIVSHFFFILFVVFGGLLLFISRRFIFLHLPAAAWGAFIEFSGRICPLTFLENHLRLKSGLTAHGEGFVEHYIIPIVYPVGLTRRIQIILGLAVIIINAVVYIAALTNRK